MSGHTITFLLLGATAGGFITGLSGTGTVLFALGFYLVVLEPVQAVAIAALMSVLAGLQGLWIVRAEIPKHPRRLLRFLIPGLMGLPLGLVLLTWMEAGTLRLIIATLLIVYGGYFSFRTALPAFTRKTPVIDSLVGLAGGVLGGASGVSGALPSMWMSLRPWTKFETRGVLQPFNAVLLITTISLLAFKGAFDRTALNALILTVPCGLIAAQVGIAVFRRLSDTGFRRLLIVLTFLMGLGILISEIT